MRLFRKTVESVKKDMDKEIESLSNLLNSKEPNLGEIRKLVNKMIHGENTILSDIWEINKRLGLKPSNIPAVNVHIKNLTMYSQQIEALAKEGKLNELKIMFESIKKLWAILERDIHAIEHVLLAA